ncbi:MULTISPECIES: hypothetical protein [Halomonadaceae]|uniref:hypothetical protein n=1 Tax=Halomonadaceae TaxID=28256 RepID=UPI001599CD4A|nr:MULTISPECIES: hypothetical protein [Halomonas]QJQ94837.1 hypothetical protein HIO72_05765 [Halomonas sp. PA5]
MPQKRIVLSVGGPAEGVNAFALRLLKSSACRIPQKPGQRLLTVLRGLVEKHGGTIT